MGRRETTRDGRWCTLDIVSKALKKKCKENQDILARCPDLCYCFSCQGSRYERPKGILEGEAAETLTAEQDGWDGPDDPGALPIQTKQLERGSKMERCPIGPARVREDKDIQTCDITGRPLDADGICLYHFVNSAEREDAK